MSAGTSRDRVRFKYSSRRRRRLTIRSGRVARGSPLVDPEVLGEAVDALGEQRS